MFARRLALALVLIAGAFWLVLAPPAAAECEPDPDTGRRCPVGEQPRPEPRICDEDCQERRRQRELARVEAEQRAANEARERVERRASALNDRGNRELDARHYDRARHFYRRALRLWPNNTVIQSNLALVDRNEASAINDQGSRAYARGDWERAAQLFRQALALLPDETAIQTNLADAERQLASGGVGHDPMRERAVAAGCYSAGRAGIHLVTETCALWDAATLGSRMAASDGRAEMLVILREYAVDKLVFMSFPRSLDVGGRVGLVRQIHTAQQREFERIIGAIRRSFEDPAQAAELRRRFALADASAVEALRRSAATENRAALERSIDAVRRTPRGAGFELECEIACRQLIAAAQGVDVLR